MRVTGRTVARRTALLAAALLFACARIEPPPGGPPDTVPPQLVSVYPDSTVVLPNFEDEVEFRFGEVVSEGASASQGLGTGDLERLIILSPDTAVPNVSWRRSRITVRPADGWKPDRVYRVQLLPGITDLRNNRTRDSATVTFTTGAPPPGDTLRGQVYDWSTSRPARGALVVAELLPDSLPYRALADSAGRFVLGPLPAGDYVVYGVLDENDNRLHDRREAFDSAHIASTAGNVGDLYAFVHDTTPPRIRTITVADSISATIEFTQPLDPTLELDAAQARVMMLPDSTPVEVRALLTVADADVADRAEAPDTALAADTAAVDTAAVADTAIAIDTAAVADTIAAPDTAAAPAGRPPLSSRLVLRVVEPWRPGGRYAVQIVNVRNVTSVTGDVAGGLIVPEAPPPTPADSLPADSLPADSVPAPVPADTVPE